MTTRRRGFERWGAPLLLIVAGLLVYSTSFAGQFIFDDYSCIVENPHIRHLWPVWNIWISPSELAIAGRPVVTLTLALNYAFHGLRVWGYHAFNLLLHLLAAITLYGIIRRTLQFPQFRQDVHDDANAIAFASALLWMVHPLLTESVTYIIQRTELLMASCLLATLYCVIRGTASTHPRRWNLAAVVACAVGMGSKEVMVVTPLLVWLYDAILLSASWREPLRRRRGLYLGFASTWIVLAVFLATHPRATTAGFGVQGLNSWSYALAQCGVILHYLHLAFWPSPLAVDYSDWPIAHDAMTLVGPAMLVVGLLGTTAWFLRRRSPIGFLGAWFFLILAPTSSILPILTEVAAERRMYVPLAAIVVLVVVGGRTLLHMLVRREETRRAVAIGLVGTSVVLLGALTIRRNDEYRSEERLLRQLIVTRPHNVHARYNLGISLAEHGKLDESTTQFQDALQMQPDDAAIHNNLGAVLLDQGHIDAAILHFKEAVRLRPDLVQPHANLEHALMIQQRHPPPSSAPLLTYDQTR